MPSPPPIARVVRVLVDVPGLERLFDYSVPAAFSELVQVGSLVRVPLSGRRVAGWVVADSVTPPAGVALKPVSSVTGLGPAPDVVDLTAWAAWRWAGRRSSLLRTASPLRVVRGLPPPPPPPRPAPSPSPPAGEGFHIENARRDVDAEHAGGDVGGESADSDLGRDDLAAESLVSARAVLRLPPAADTFAVVAAAAALGDALVLAPSIEQAAVVARRLRAAGRAVALMPGEWAAAAAGGCTVVGSRAAAWAPAPRLAAVVVLDAHEEVYQEERAPTWNAWQVGAERARRAGVPCVLVSPCPTLEQLGWGALVKSSRTQEREGWPALDIVDRRTEDPRKGLYSERLVRLLRSGQPVAAILNRTGRARLLACTACRDVTRCETCQSAMEQRSGAGILSCRRCGAERAVVCQSCGSSRLKTLRVGVARVREELEALANVPVGEVTAASTEVPDTRVLVGTDALLHRLPVCAGTGIPGNASSASTPANASHVSRAVVFLDFDQELLAPRYRAAEQALALLARAARVAGGRSAGGRVLVQTRLPDHEVLAAALHADPDRVALAERPRRAELSFPPATALAQVSGPQAGAFVAGLPAIVEALGPDDGRWLLRAPDHQILCDGLAATLRPAGRLRVEVDPLRL